MGYEETGDDFNEFGEFIQPDRGLSDEPNGPEMSEEQAPEGESGVSLWDDPANLESLKMERELHPDETNEDMAKRFLREALPNVTQGLIRLALNASNENTKLNAQKYVMDMVLKEGDAATAAAWEDLVGTAVSQAELHANTGSATE